MKIALVSTISPFVRGGASNIVEWLDIKIRELNHESKIFWLPQYENPDTLIQQTLIYDYLDFDYFDIVITFRPMSHLINHRNKVVWFIHHIRNFYDYWGLDDYRGFPITPRTNRIRELLLNLDTAALNDAVKLFTNSETVSNRLMKFNGLSSSVLYPPLLDGASFRNSGFNNEVVCVARITHHKRQELLINAMSFTQSDVKLRIVGKGDEFYFEKLNILIDKLGVRHKILIENTWVTENEKIELLANCLGVVYTPLDEDSYGYASLEAAHSEKAIITTTDSGGVLEFVKDNYNGLIVAPNARQLGEAFDLLNENPDLAIQWGVNNKKRLNELKISWAHVIDSLLT
jgi:glycosyltransferase involved in cell wall biosynthesis